MIKGLFTRFVDDDISHRWLGLKPPSSIKEQTPEEAKFVDELRKLIHDQYPGFDLDKPIQPDYAAAVDALAGGYVPNVGRGAFVPQVMMPNGVMYPLPRDPIDDTLYLGNQEARHNIFAHFPNSDEDAYFKQIEAEIDALNNDPRRMTHRVVAVVTVKFRDDPYMLVKDYGVGYAPSTVHFDWHENNHSCDHRRFELFSEQYPDVVLTIKDELLSASCGQYVFPVVKFVVKFEE